MKGAIRQAAEDAAALVAFVLVVLLIDDFGHWLFGLSW